MDFASQAHPSTVHKNNEALISEPQPVENIGLRLKKFLQKLVHILAMLLKCISKIRGKEANTLTVQRRVET